MRIKGGDKQMMDRLRKIREKHCEQKQETQPKNIKLSEDLALKEDVAKKENPNMGSLPPGVTNNFGLGAPLGNLPGFQQGIPYGLFDQNLKRSIPFKRKDEIVSCALVVANVVRTELSSLTRNELDIFEATLHNMLDTD